MKTEYVKCNLCLNEVMDSAPGLSHINTNDETPLTLTVDLLPSGAVREPDGSIIMDAHGVTPEEVNFDVCEECLHAALLNYLVERPELVRAMRRMMKDLFPVEEEDETPGFEQLTLFSGVEEPNAEASSSDGDSGEYAEYEATERDPETDS